MVFTYGETTAVFEIDEKFVIGCDDERYDVILNPGNVQRNEPHDALNIIAKTDKTLRIAIVVKHDKDAVYSASLYGDELHITYNSDEMTINVRTGELLHYEKDAVKEEFDFSELDNLLK